MITTETLLWYEEKKTLARRRRQQLLLQRQLQPWQPAYWIGGDNVRAPAVNAWIQAEEAHRLMVEWMKTWPALFEGETVCG